jgi:hypothetical protein
MRRLLLAAVTIAALGGCAREATGAAAITPEPAASPLRSTTTVEGSAELARPTAPVATTATNHPGAHAIASATPTAAPTEAPAIRSIPLAITGMT